MIVLARKSHQLAVHCLARHIRYAAHDDIAHLTFTVATHDGDNPPIAGYIGSPSDETNCMSFSPQ